MAVKKWTNPDLHNIGDGLLDPLAADMPYLAEIRDKLDLIIGNGTTDNNRREYFNITNTTQLETDLAAWCTANPNTVIIDREYIQDAAGTNIYMITYL